MVSDNIYYPVHVSIHVFIGAVTGCNTHFLKPPVYGVIKHVVVHILVYLSGKHIQRNAIIGSVSRHHAIPFPE